MRVTYVVFPVLRGTRRFFVEKGRRWSVVEHLLLDAVCDAPASAAKLAADANLPKRVVVEAFIRLMRASWVEIISTATGPQFRATPLGLINAPLDQLPAATVTEPKWRGFAIEQITGGVFRSRELDIRPNSRLPITTDDQTVVHLQGRQMRVAGDLCDVFAAIEGEDELIVGIDRSPERLIEQHAVVTVQNEIIEGLPARASAALRSLILASAKEAANTVATGSAEAGSAHVASVPLSSSVQRGNLSILRNALYDYEDVIVDGAAHKAALERLIRSAGERVIIHSTFIGDASAQALLPILLQAASRGVRVEILWGQDDVGGAVGTSRAAGERLKVAIANAGRADAIFVHPFSTNSHAKIVVADNGRGRWTALVGSCNWLASDFTSFEASIRLRDSALVGDLVQALAGLSRGRPGVWHDFAIQMTVLGRRVANIPQGNGRTVPMRILFGAEHAKFVLEARDRATKRIFILSHRIGIAARAVALLPTLAAVQRNQIDALLYYGRTTGALSGVDGAELTREFAKEGLEIRPVHRPRLHAKVLGWDDNALAVSSLNWLSADPSDAMPYREIGVFVEAPKIADNFIRVFENSRTD